jgi:TRAP-type transport system periplasmic protein
VKAFFRSTLIAAVCVLAGAAVTTVHAQQYIIKFASIATEGSTWMNVMHDLDAAIRKESGGRVGFKIYAGGVQGEDKDVMRKIRLGQLHSAGITGVGVGEISPKLRVLDSPFLFRSYAEVDHFTEAFGPELDQEFRRNDFVLLGWAEVGFVYVLTNTPVRGVKDMHGVKMWSWEGDPIADAAFHALGISSIPLSVTDVFTSLQTGLINGAYTSPLAAVALQWNTRVKYMTNVPLADASGAVVVSKKKFDSLPADIQEILLRNGKKFMTILTQKSREENAAAIQTMKRNGVQIIEITDPKTIDEFYTTGMKARQSLVGKLFDQEFLNRVEKSVADFRATQKGTK